MIDEAIVAFEEKYVNEAWWDFADGGIWIRGVKRRQGGSLVRTQECGEEQHTWVSWPLSHVNH